MDKTYQKLISGAAHVVQGLALSLLMVWIVIALARHPPGQLR
ncbi:MAG: hypothetical protein P8Y53_05980 [Pseudolabrys sp.]|jgi:hypothetical protein